MNNQEMAEGKILAHSLSSKERTKDVILSENVSFSSLILPPEIVKGLTASGFEKPSPIQVKALPVGRCGFDLIVKSKSGTGKTLIFATISLESIKLRKLEPQVLLLAPTREIAVQIQDVIKSIGKYYEGLSVECFIGGLPLATDKAKCKSCHIAVGTPGRLKQLIRDGSLKVDSVKIFVLDEADKLTEESFQNDINEIYNTLPDRKQIIMCSATYPEEMQTFLDQYTLSPVMVTVELESPLLLGLKQYARLMKPPPSVVQQLIAKNEQLLKILSTVPFLQCLVFSNYQIRAESINYFLNEKGWNSITMSGAQKQTERLHSLSNLKDFKCKILVTTDLAARGIDAQNVDLVINYDVPSDAVTYLHRMGRAGRYGSCGNCINIAFLGQESNLLQHILGVIGGQNFSIPVIDESFNLDLNQIPKENYLCGEVANSSTDFISAYSEIRHLLAENVKTETKKDKKRNSKSRGFTEENLNAGTATILAELASGTFLSANANTGESTDEKTNPDQMFVMQQLVDGGEVITNHKKEESKSEPNLDSSFFLQQLATDGEVLNFSLSATQNLKKHPQNEMLCKNKALFSVAKLLSDVEVANEDCNDLSAYFSNLKSQESHSDTRLTSSEVLENIFSFAYKSQISKGVKKWQNLLPDEDKEKLKEDFITEADEETFDEDYYDEDYDFEIEKDIEVEYTENRDDYSFMEWIPVESGTHQRQHVIDKEEPRQKSAVAKKQETQYYEHYDASELRHSKYHAEYDRYFQHCSNNLWQNGLAFDSVRNFDEWFFNNWEGQLDAVRTFVQQNIYLKEMSNYQ